MKLRFRSLLELVAFRRRYTFQKLKPNTFPCTRYFVHAEREDTDTTPPSQVFYFAIRTLSSFLMSCSTVVRSRIPRAGGNFATSSR